MAHVGFGNHQADVLAGMGADRCSLEESKPIAMGVLKRKHMAMRIQAMFLAIAEVWCRK